MTVLFVLWAMPAPGADLAGSRDHPLLKRFGGSEIVGYDVKRFDEYTLQTSTFTRYNLDSKRPEFTAPTLALEGAVTRLWYEAAGETGSAELTGNYRNELMANDFTLLYDSTKDPKAGQWTGFLNTFADIDIQTNRSNYVFYGADKQSLRVLTAVKKRAEGDLYVSVTVVEWAKDDAVYRAKRGAYAAVDIIECCPMTQNMVVVTADEMAESIDQTGRVALYGIFFDTAQTTIKPESREALREIAALLTAQVELAVHIVGHTDNQGGFEYNLDLSRRRAEAVKTALVKEFGIDGKRLSPNGVAYLAPVASNETEEGRAKNRRVELVPR